MTYPPSPLDLDSPLVSAYCRKTAGSARLADGARSVFPSGITHDARYIEPHGIYVTRTEGAHKWDVDGNDYVDYSGGHGALLLGHNHPVVIAAVQEQLSKGTHYGANHELEIEWGELIQKMVPCAERVRLTNTGTETTMLALRLARAFTGREKVLRIKGHFHGWHDYASAGFISHFDGTPARGVPAGTNDSVLLTPVNDLAAAEEVFAAHADIAAVILEPTGSTWGQVPTTQEFIEGLRRLASQYGTILIFDEVISGFRCAPGGAQEALGVTPDLAILGKIVSGGLTGAAVVGRKDVLDVLDFRVTAQSGDEKVFHMGTFNAAPTTAAAGIAALGLIRSTDTCRQAIAYGDKLIDSLNEMFNEESVSWISYGTYGGFHVFLNPENISTTRQRIEAAEHSHDTLKAPVAPALRMKLRIGVLLHGVDIQGWPGAPVTAAHNDSDLDHTVEAFRQTIRLLREEGDLD